MNAWDVKNAVFHVPGIHDTLPISTPLFEQHHASDFHYSH